MVYCTALHLVKNEDPGNPSANHWIDSIWGVTIGADSMDQCILEGTNVMMITYTAPEDDLTIPAGIQICPW